MRIQIACRFTTKGGVESTKMVSVKTDKIAYAYEFGPSIVFSVDAKEFEAVPHKEQIKELKELLCI